MKRHCKRIPIAIGVEIVDKYRYRTILEGDPCPPEGQHSIIEQYKLLQTIVDTPHLLHCGPKHFETLRMFHSGVSWVIETEAIIREEEVAETIYAKTSNSAPSSNVGEQSGNGGPEGGNTSPQETE